jgi:divinyl protochlorophyllide a 8-vinyl-reductase
MWCLPSRKASRLLAAAIGRKAWTFAGTGRFSVQHSRGATSTMPYCDFYAGKLERLFTRLIRARVVEAGCQAMGGPKCAFSIR